MRRSRMRPIHPGEVLREEYLVPLELSDLRFSKDHTTEDVLGKHGLKKLGLDKWEKALSETVEFLGKAFVTDSGKVGVLATPATVRSEAYLRALGRQHRSLQVTEVEAPDLADGGEVLDVPEFIPPA